MTARRIRNRPEQVAHIAVIDFLRLALPAAAMVWHTPNEAKRSVVERVYLRRMGLMPGFPDIAILMHGRLWVAEMKAPGETTSRDQDVCISHLMLCGAKYLGIWRSPDDAEKSLIENGIDLRATVFGKGVARLAA